jgi:hypothetical protein
VGTQAMSSSPVISLPLISSGAEERVMFASN